MSLRTFILGLAASFGIAWLFGVIIPFIKMRNLQPIELNQTLDGAVGVFYPKRGGRFANGARVYGENGCYLCHTQVVRPTYAGNDMYRPDWGGLQRDPDRGDTRRESNAYDYFGETFAHIGTTRIGPDLSNVARRVEAAVAAKGSGDATAEFYAHLYDPRRTPELRKSACPSHRYLFATHEIKGQRSLDALPFGGTETTEVVPTADAKALVSYLLSMKKDQPAPAALNFAPVDPKTAAQ
jgi:cytochrome c oxidase cbb3-type subunit 2